MRKSLRACIVVAFFALGAGAALAQPPGDPLAQPPGPAAQPEEADRPLTDEEIAKLKEAFKASIHPRTGKIEIAEAHATLTVPDGFYYLDVADSRHVLEDIWGNPPDPNIDGMLFKAGVTAVDDDQWGVLITHENTGYVSDEDAKDIDYDMLASAMRDGEAADNAARKRQGYPTISLVGWAATPRYDAKTHKLYWAKELEFDGEPEHTLNYDMRVLGRQGVLSLNFITAMAQLPQVEAAGPAVLAIPEFDKGFRYEDYQAGVDAKSDLGVVGLIGGAGAAALLAKNAGILTVVLGFLAKGWYLIVAALLGAGAWVRNLFGGKAKAKADTTTRVSGLDTSFMDGPADPPPSASEPPGSEPPKS